jgi:hypothetical protein
MDGKMKIFSALIIGLCLTGCATPPPQTPKPVQLTVACIPSEIAPPKKTVTYAPVKPKPVITEPIGY